MPAKQGDLFRAPRKATRRRPYRGLPPYQEHSDTSQAASASVAESASGMRARVLDYIKASPTGRTRDEIEVGLGLLMQTVSPRVCELAELGLIEDSGERRPTRRGRKAVVWHFCKSDTESSI